jgi:cytochrome c peroxidase
MKPQRPRTIRQAYIGIAWGVIALVGLWLFRPESVSPGIQPNQAWPQARDDQPFPPLPDPARLGLDVRRVDLGRHLFHDPRLSADGSVSCASCHDLAHGGADPRPVSIGVAGKPGFVNSPTVYNSAFNFTQFWDGRASTLEDQVASPITSPTEFASTWPEVLGRLAEDQNLVAAFKAAYPEGLSATSVQHAIAEFERSLTTPSRFDRFLHGDQSALNGAERKGYELFRSYGCVSCHQGINIGGNVFQKLGVARDYFADKATTRADQGRYNVTRHPNDRHVFKVPSLRNVALTAPYFHNASANTLGEAVTVMARYQLGVELPAEDLQSLVAFLGSLTGERLQP